MRRAFLFIFLVSFGTLSVAQDDESEEGCFTGPAVKEFGFTMWNVYSCGNPDSLAIVSATGSPAMPFYFMIVKQDGVRRLFGEGTGNKEATSAAAEVLKILIESDEAVQALIAETIEAEQSE